METASETAEEPSAMRARTPATASGALVRLVPAITASGRAARSTSPATAAAAGAARNRTSRSVATHAIPSHVQVLGGGAASISVNVRSMGASLS
jgi:hypothetical protein